MTAATVFAAPNALPAPVRRLAYAGLAPFVGGALLVWLVHDEVRADVAFALAAYAALIASFLGGVHWGLAFAQAEPPARWLAFGVAPALLAWPALLMPPNAGLVIDGAVLAACYAVDRRIYPAAGAARWLTLRFRLSTVAALCCFIGAAGA